MDFRTMKRKELQALCKQHKIPANLSNLEMAKKLAEFFNEKKNSSIQGLIKGQDEIASKTESTNVAVDRKVKKVRFSPEHELIEFTRSRDIKRRTRRNSASSRDSSLSVENVDGGQMNNENVSYLGRITRSRGLKPMESEVNEKERVKKGVKCYSQKNNVAAVKNFRNGEFMEDGVDKPGAMQLREKISVQGIRNPSKKGRKRAKDDNKTGKKALENANDEELIEEVVDIPGRLTRSRGEKLMEDSMRKDKRRKVLENNDNAVFVNAETDDNREVNRKSLRTRRIEVEGKLARGLGERAKNNEKIMVEPQILLRRSKRNMNRVGDSEILNDDTKIHENDGMKGLRRTPKLLAVEGSGVDAKSTGSKVDLDGGIALPIGEPIKQGLRRSNRRKNAIAAHENLENDELKDETENRSPLRNSIPQLGSAGGISKGDKKVLQPTGVMRRSRRKNLSFELVSSDETINTDAATENFEAENHSSKPCPVEKEGPAARRNARRSRRNASKKNSVEILPEFGVDSTVQQKNETRKRERGPISGGDVIKTNNDSSSPMQSMRKECGSEKATPAAATGKVSDISELPNMLDASSRKDLLEIGESFVNAEFFISEGAESINNTGLISDTNVETVISDVRLTSSKKIHRKRQDISIADSARNGDTRLINRNELANSEENAVSRIAELKTDHTDNEKQISASKLRGEEKIHSSLEFDVKESNEENISDTDNNDTAALVFSQTEVYSCNNTIDHQVLLEGSIVSRNACFVEISYSSDSLSPCDQTVVKSDPEVAEAEADKQAQSGLEEVDGEVECVSAQEILQSVEIGCTNSISSPIICHNNDVDHLEPAANISRSNNEDTCSKAGEAGASESCDRHIGTTDFKSALQLKEASPGRLARSLEGDNIAEGDEIYSHKGIDSEDAENDEGGCLRDHEVACSEDSEFSRHRVIPQDKGHAIISSDENDKEDTSPKAEEVGAFESCDGHSESTDLKSALQLEKPSSGKVIRSLEGDNIAEGDEIHTNKGIDSEVLAEDGEGGCLRDHDPASNEDSESSVPRIIQQDRGHEVISSDENNKEDTSPKVGEVGVFEFCDRHIESTDLKSALPLEEPSSGKLTRRLEGDNTAEEDEIYSHKGIESEVVENDDSRCLSDHETASNEDGEFIVPELFGERSARIIPQDRGHAVTNIDEHKMHNTSEINLTRSQGAYHIAKTDETYNKSVHSEVVEAKEGGSSGHHKSKCHEDAEYGVSNLFAAERSARIMPQDKAIFSRKKSIKNFDKKGMFQDSPSEPPTTMGTSAKIKLRRDHEADQTAEAETYVYKDIQSELGTADEAVCLEHQTSTKDEDWLFGVSNLFDAERSAPTTPQDASTMCANCNEVKFIAGGSSSHEISPSKPNGVFASKGIVSTISKTCEIIHKEAGATDNIEGREGAIFQSNGKNELFNQADAHTNKDTYEPAVERPKSPVADSIQGQDRWSNESETARQAMAMFKTNGKGKASQVAQGPNTDGDASDQNCGKDKEDMVDASITDSSTSMYYAISRIGVESLKELKFQDIKETEHECGSPLAAQAVSDAGEDSSDISSRSWTEFELNALFGTTADGVTPTRLNDTSCQGTEIATLTISVNNSVTSSTSSLTKKKKKMEVERGSEDAKTVNKNVVLQPDYEEASNNGFSLGIEENQLILLFATPIKILTPCKVDETSAHEGKLDNAAMFKECVRRMKENAATQIKSDEKVGDSRNEFEYSLSVGNPVPHNGEDVTVKELNQVEGVELVNNCTTPVLSGCEYDGCEASKQQLTENTCECMRETKFITEENEEEKIISLGQSCHYREATDNHSEVTEKDISRSSGALKNLHKVEGCTDTLMDTDLSENLSCGSRSYLKSEGELAQSTEVAVELYDAGFQDSSSHENGHCGYVDGNILRETSFDNFRGPMHAEVANVGSFDGGSYLIQKGTSPSLFPKASYNDDEVAERKDTNSIRANDDPYHDISHTRHETDNPSRSHDISDELHPNGKVAILRNLSVSFTPSQEAHKLQSTLELQYKETNLTGVTTQNADTVVPAAEHKSSLCGAESDILSSMAMHRLLGDSENGDIKKSEARTPLFNLEDDVEKNGQEVVENSTEAIAQFSILKLQLEEKFVDSNNNIHTISDVSASRCNEILKESDVADTIQGYIDSEFSLSMDFEGSGASLPIDVLAHIDEKSTCKNAVVCESTQAIGDRPSVESLGTESHLEESTLFMKPAPVSEEAVKSSPAPIDLPVESSTANKPSVEKKGAAITETFLISKEIGTLSKQLYSTPKKNARTILIHGTPRKLLTTADMKENAPMHKSSNIGDFTTVRPAKRKALQDVQWR